MADERETVIDWESRDEPWRSVGLAFCAELRNAAPPPPSPVKRPDLLTAPITEANTPGDHIRNLRLARRWSMGQLARAAGLASFKSVQRVERNQPTLTSTRVAIARALSVSFPDIWPDETA